MQGFVVLFAATLLVASQDQPPRTTFRSAVDLVPVDVNVLDKNGRPIADLAVGDFTLAVDGKPRRIASAQFISVPRAIEAAAPPRVEYSSNGGAAGGRLVMLVMDVGNIAIGRGRAAVQAAQRFVARLNPADRVALVTIPGAGPQMEFTSNHALVQNLLGNLVGQATSRAVAQRVGLSEALAFARNDQSSMAAVTDRECSIDIPALLRESCVRQVAVEANRVLSAARDRTANSLIALRYLFDRVGTSETPKTIVFISEGLFLDRENSDLAWVGPRAAAAHIILYVLQLDSPEMEASDRTTSPSRGADRGVLRDGLEQLAGRARGDVFQVVVNADFAFQRLALELSGYYLLSFEPEPGDRDGKPHKIKIDVRRKDVTLRARREFSVGAAAARTPVDTVLEALRTPLLAAEIPLKLTTYTFQDPESQKLKIILVADIDRALDPDGDVSLGYLMLDDEGKVVSSDLEKTVAAPVDRRSKVQKYIGAVIVGPGTYTIKLAVADQEGKRGSVERTFAAKINGFGQLHVTDLVVAEEAAGAQGGLPLAVAADFTGAELHAYVELFSEVQEQLRGATVVMEVAQSDTAPAFNAVPARFQQVAEGNRRVAQAAVSIAQLPPGEYQARAVVSVAGRRVGRVTRPFRITRATMTAAAPGTSAVPMRPADPIAFTSRIDAFDRTAVLTPQVLGFFLDRMSASAAADAATVRPAVASVRAGRFDEAMTALEQTPDDRLAAVFLKGLVLLHRGNLDQAAARFRDALRLDAEFSSAAFYLGACYAAGGKDRDAAATWQAALITESNAPFVYTLLGDALLRLRSVDRAIDILTEARALWPSDDSVTQRLAAAFVMAGKSAEALHLLEPSLAAHPADHERLLLALRALYEARAAGRTVSSAADDTALFRRYADAYKAAGGPQQALVDQWRKSF